jgi:hypothetical protein
MPGFVIECGYDEALALASVGAGWADLVREGLAAVAGYGCLVQVKEKYGTLRLYWDGEPGITRRKADAIQHALDKLESKSGALCEQCGAPGRLIVSKGGWYRTACPEHTPENCRAAAEEVAGA